MRIIRFQAENVKKLSAVDITPDGALVQITGPNGSGKSSVLDAIYMALAGKTAVPSAVVRKGHENARVRLDLGDIIVTRKFESDGKTTLTVESTEGARFPSPQAMLDGLIGPLTFDPLEFIRLDPKAQLEKLRGMVTLEEDLDVLDELNRRDYEQRTEANRDIRTLQSRVGGIEVPEGTPEQPVDVSALLEEMTAASRKNDVTRRQFDERRRAQSDIVKMIEEAARKRREAATLLSEAETLEQSAELAQIALDGLVALPELVDVEELRQQVEQGRRTNNAVERLKQRRLLEGEVADMQRRAEELTIAIDGRTQRKQKVIAAATMPVPGLGFGDGEVTYNGLPLANASDAEKLRVSVAIAMAGNPKLRVLRIKDGSLLDENSLAMIATMADTQDYQVWLERVDTSRKVGVVMEDGAVASVH